MSVNDTIVRSFSYESSSHESWSPCISTSSIKYLSSEDPQHKFGISNGSIILNQMIDAEKDVWIEAPFYFIYGKNIHMGQGSFINMNCNFIDDGKIIVGKKVLFGPAVTVVTVGHPVNPQMREYMYTDPVVIEDNVWIGANVTICPGVTIGENSVIGAGSVVVKDIPANCVAVGNPCRVIRQISQRDKEYYYKDRKIDEADLEEEAGLRNK